MRPRHRNIKAQRERKESTVVDTIIIHAMSEYIINEGETQFCINFLNDIDLGAHYFIAPDGQVIHAMNPRHRTSHVGNSEYLGRKWLNETSIGIEFLVDGVNNYSRFIQRIDDDDEKSPFTDEQYEAGQRLIYDIQEQFPKVRNRIVGHNAVSGDRVRGKRRGKRDPGLNFDWSQLEGDE